MDIKQVILSLILTTIIASTAQSAEININLTDLRSDEGVIRIGLFTSIEAYEDENPIKAMIITTEEANDTISFKQVPEGEYLIALYHDENNNAEMDSVFFGLIPDEGYGFSNNPGVRFGPPDINKALINMKKDSELHLNIQVKY